jgi:hypothetical protein
MPTALPRADRFVAALCVVLLVAAGGGCATRNLFKAYPRRMAPVVAGIRQGAPDKPLDFLHRKSPGADAVLDWAERGRLAHAAGRLDMSMRDFDAALAEVRERDSRAVVSASGLGATGGSLLLNDTVIPYKLQGYERVFLHHYQALNYLFQGDLEGAGVEVRRANLEQEEALRRHRREIERAENRMREEGAGGFTSELDQAYRGMETAAGRVKDSFQNAATFFVSGIVYELRGELNDAYIDYRKALEIHPDNPVLRRDVARLALALGMTDDLGRWRAQFSDVVRDAETAARDPNACEVVVIIEHGFAPVMQEIQLPLPTPFGPVFTAFPVYQGPWPTPPRAQVGLDATSPPHAGGKGGSEAALVCDVTALAVKSLKERAPLLAAREIVRVGSRGVVQSQASGESDPLGIGFSALQAFALSRADLRSWSTLPGSVQIARLSAPHGVRTLRVAVDGGGPPLETHHDLTPGGVAVVRVFWAQPAVYCVSRVFPRPPKREGVVPWMIEPAPADAPV